MKYNWVGEVYEDRESPNEWIEWKAINYLLYHLIISSAASLSLETHPWLLAGVLIRHFFLPAQQCLDLEQAAMIYQE